MLVSSNDKIKNKRVKISILWLFHALALQAVGFDTPVCGPFLSFGQAKKRVSFERIWNACVWRWAVRRLRIEDSAAAMSCLGVTAFGSF